MVEKTVAPLSSVRPSGVNPRRDFGDIDALADTIRATGGMPVNPIVAVRDGNVYRIVDGERRYRALRKIYRSAPDTPVEVLAADSMDEADELVAMLATDDKQPLTDEERARGVQGMLLLGVDEQKVARAARVGADKVSAARRMAGHAPEGRQLTLDQMAAAAEYEDDPEARDRILLAEDWRFEADAVRRERKVAAFADSWERWCDRSGCELFMGGAFVGDGYSYMGRSTRDPFEMERDDPHSIDDVAAVAVSGAVAFLYRDAADAADSEEERERAERSRAADESGEAVRESARCMAAHLLSERGLACPDLMEEARVAAMRNVDDDSDGMMPEGALERAEGEAASFRDAVRLVSDRMPTSGLVSGYSGDLVGWSCRMYCDMYDLAVLAGYGPSEADAALYAQAKEGCGR